MFLQWLFKPDTLIYLAFCNEYIQWEIFLYVHGGLLCSISSLNCKKLGDSMIRVKKLWLEGHIWSVDKESTCQWRRSRRCRFDPWVEKIPWRRKWQPTPVFLPGKSQGQRSLAGYGSWDHKESDMTWVRAHTHTKYSFKFGVAKIQQNFLSSEAISKMATRWKSHYKNVTGNAFIFLRVCLCVCVCLSEREREKGEREGRRKRVIFWAWYSCYLCAFLVFPFSLFLFSSFLSILSPANLYYFTVVLRKGTQHGTEAHISMICHLHWLEPPVLGLKQGNKTETKIL